MGPRGPLRTLRALFSEIGSLGIRANYYASQGASLFHEAYFSYIGEIVCYIGVGWGPISHYRGPGPYRTLYPIIGDQGPIGPYILL